MNLYLISQNVNNSYDTFDSAVVAAESEEDARGIEPGTFDTWTQRDNVSVEFLGRAADEITRGVICASFNAG